MHNYGMAESGQLPTFAIPLKRSFKGPVDSKTCRTAFGSWSALCEAFHKADYAKYRIMEIRLEKGAAKAEVMRHGSKSSFP